MNKFLNKDYLPRAEKFVNIQTISPKFQPEPSELVAWYRIAKFYFISAIEVIIPVIILYTILYGILILTEMF
jgi:hypothetical protein